MVDIRSRATAQLARWGPLGGDAFLYLASALFAGATALFSGIALYRVWGEMAAGPYLAAAAVATVFALRRRRRRGCRRPGRHRQARPAPGWPSSASSSSPPPWPRSPSR